MDNKMEKKNLLTENIHNSKFSIVRFYFIRIISFTTNDQNDNKAYRDMFKNSKVAF